MHRIAILFVLAGCTLIPVMQTGRSAASPGSPGSPDPGGGAATTGTATSDGGRQIVEGRKTYRVGPYWGPECERIGAPKNNINHYVAEKPTMGKQPNLGHDPQDQILRLVCVDRILGSEGEPGSNTWVMQHARFDELAFDHWTAAMMLVECLEAESCLDDHAPPQQAMPEGHPDMQQRATAARAAHEIPHLYQVAMMRWYAERVDPAKVAARLAQLPLDAQAQQTYMALVAKAKDRVLAVSGQLPPDVKHLFVDIPEEVHAHHAAMLAKHAAQITALTTLVERVRTERAGKSGVADATVDQLRQLRIAYHMTCSGDCTRDLIFVGISRQLFWSYVSRGDGPAALAEAKLLEHPEPSAAAEIGKQQRDAINDVVGRSSRMARAREQGVDADTAHAAGSPSDLGDGRYVYDVDSERLGIDYAGLVPDAGEIGQVGGKVASVERQGANTLVRFADRVSSYSESTGCYETNRIDGISPDGKLIYRQACSGSETHVERSKVVPVMIPASEAAGLSGGDEVVAFAHAGADPRLARIWVVKRGTRVARLRDVAL